MTDSLLGSGEGLHYRYRFFNPTPHATFLYDEDDEDDTFLWHQQRSLIALELHAILVHDN